jgi:hypothetical protein
MKRLEQWSVKELVEGYGDVVPEIGNESDHIDALKSVLDYEVDSYNEKYNDEIEQPADTDLLELNTDEDLASMAMSISQY